MMNNMTKKEKLLLAFTAAAMLICLIPLVCMTFARTDTTTEKKELAPMPSLFEDGSFNIDYLGQLGDYFSDHFAFRQQLVSLDSAIRGRIFGVSTVDSVVVGRDGWLFFTDTVNDFTGAEPLSDRALFNIANNISIMQQYAEANGARFVFTIAPNKNTLYPQFMPYTLTAADRSSHNAIRLREKLDALGVNYVDLFDMFDARGEVLYLKRDSHWNDRGALLVCNELLRAADREDAVYVDGDCELVDFTGDLNSMLYPLNSKPEKNYDYGISGYDTVTGSGSVEDALIVTSCSDAPGSLLMYRDSFGNSMLPFMARAFGSAAFMRTVPYNTGMHTGVYQPDTVIVEKVERNIDELASMPPVLESADTELETVSGSDVLATVEASAAEENFTFWRFDGEIDNAVADNDTRIFLRITCDDGYCFTREAFTVSNDDTDYAFRLYVSQDTIFEDSSAQVEVIACCLGEWHTLCSENIYFSTSGAGFDE